MWFATIRLTKRTVFFVSTTTQSTYDNVLVRNTVGPTADTDDDADV